MKNLTIEQKIATLEYILEDEDFFINSGLISYGGLCLTICHALLKIHRYTCKYCEIVEYFPMFTRENAIVHANATIGDDDYWWHFGEENNRIKFIEWMIEELNKLK